jgi:transcription initiation factor TFIIB
MNQDSTNPESIKCSIDDRSHVPITDYESGEVVCGNCGIVLITIDSFEVDDSQGQGRGQQHLAFTSFETSSSNSTIGTGASTSLLSRHDRGLATIIGRPDVDASGKKLESDMRSTFKRLRTWDARTQMSTSTNRNLLRAFSELKTLKDKLGLSDYIVEKTAYIYRKVEERGLIRGRTIYAMLAACVYLSCRETGTPRTIKDVATESNIKRKGIARCVRIITHELDIRAPAFDLMKCIAKIANTSKVSEKTKRQAFTIMKQANKRKIPAGKDPMGLAASVLYIACKGTAENTTQRDMARAGGVTEVTIRNRVRDLGKSLNLPAV